MSVKAGNEYAMYLKIEVILPDKDHHKKAQTVVCHSNLLKRMNTTVG